jgi:mediator of RNA polymerase II transcription subunit 16
LQFSIYGQDLAAVDNMGIVHIFTCTTGLSRMNPMSITLRHDRPVNDIDTVVGLQWLMQWPIDFRVRREAHPEERMYR